MTTWQRDDRALWRRSGDRIVLLAPDDEQPALLNGVASLVWLLVAEPIAERQLFALLADRFERPFSEIESEARPFLDDLANRGALQSEAAAS